jgi:hypothetical protein
MTGLHQTGVARENLVFTSGYGYPHTYVRSFLKSISRNMKSADVVLFYHQTSRHCVNQLHEYLGRVRVVKPSGHVVRRAISFLPRGRGLTSRLVHQVARKLDYEGRLHALIDATLHIHCARYSWVKSYCDVVDISRYKKIMLCDARDVIVQNDAFERIDERHFVTGGEEKRIREDSLGNQAWIRHYYGPDILNKLLDEWIICAGVSLGPREMVLEYVHEMVREVDRVCRPSGFGDQAIHNYLIRTKRLNFPVHVSKSTEGIIATLYHYDHHFEPKRIVLDTSHNISLENGAVPCIVHQYDRFPKLRRHYSVIY